jgi:hypothetical protein
VPLRRSLLVIACSLLCLAVAGCGGGGKKKEQQAQLLVSLAAVPNKLPGEWDASIKVVWNNDRSARRLAVPLPKNGTVDVFTIPGTAVYDLSALIEPVDHSSASGACKLHIPLLPKQRVHATVHVDRTGNCTVTKT